MAASVQAMSLVSGLKIVRDSALSAVDADTVSGAATIYIISIDNTANAATTVYVKLYNAAAPTLGTTAPDIIIPVIGGSTVKVIYTGGCAFATALSIACTTTAGTAGTTAPASGVAVAVTVG